VSREGNGGAIPVHPAQKQIKPTAELPWGHWAEDEGEMSKGMRDTHAVAVLRGTPLLRFEVGAGTRRSDRPEWVGAYGSKEGADGFESEGDEGVRCGETDMARCGHSLKGGRGEWCQGGGDGLYDGCLERLGSSGGVQRRRLPVRDGLM